MFCQCGREIKNGQCPRCKEKTIEWGKQEVKERIGKYSGYSKNKEYRKDCVIGVKKNYEEETN